MQALTSTNGATAGPAARTSARNVIGRAHSSPSPRPGRIARFRRRGQGWRLRQRGAPPKAPLRPSSERGRSPVEGDTAEFRTHRFHADLPPVRRTPTFRRLEVVASVMAHEGTTPQSCSRTPGEHLRRDESQLTARWIHRDRRPGTCRTTHSWCAVDDIKPRGSTPPSRRGGPE